MRANRLAARRLSSRVFLTSATALQKSDLQLENLTLLFCNFFCGIRGVLRCLSARFAFCGSVFPHSGLLGFKPFTQFSISEV